MTLPEHLIKAAFLGTAKQPFSSETVLNDASAVSLREENPAAQLLLSVATLKLREQAGYIAGKMHLPLPDACQPETTTVCSDQAMRHLRLMLKGIHGFALREWFTVAIKAHRHVQADLVPNLLLLGLNKKDLRPYILPVLGQRGLWLALEINNQNWKWVFDTPDYPIDDVIAFERHYEQDIITQLREKPLDQLLNQSATWFKHHMVWSDELTEALLNSIETAQAPQWSGPWWFNHVIRQYVDYTYFFPFHYRKEFLRRLEVSPKYDKGTAELIENFHIIYDFRQSMVEAIRAEGN